MKLADALLRRKELNEKVVQVNKFKNDHVYEFGFERRPVSDTHAYDDIKSQVSKIELNQVTQEYDYYANKLRLIDAAIQQANWTTDIKVDENVWIDYPNKKK